tara:strand:- start:667 stop:1371 length:705 start_codon:yes stop_codon:yes gene_type:complete
MLRELVLDTETTGLSHENGDKIVEIGIVELINHIPTKQYFHKYINPERLVSESAFKIHGLSQEFLKTKPKFSEICEEMLAFIGNDNIIIHNASFDLGFLNNELVHVQKDIISSSKVIDTLTMAREKFPGSPASLDALCRRFTIDNSHRDLHGALLDSYILAQVYLELIGGSQPDFDLSDKNKQGNNINQNNSTNISLAFNRSQKVQNRLTKEELDSHKKFIDGLNGLTKWAIYN